MPVSHFSKVSQDYLPFTYIGEIMNVHVVCVGVKSFYKPFPLISNSDFSKAFTLVFITIQ